MAIKMTALRLDEETWENAKLAARRWAVRQGFRPEGKLTEFVEDVIRKASASELGREGA